MKNRIVIALVLLVTASLAALAMAQGLHPSKGFNGVQLSHLTSRSGSCTDGSMNLVVATGVVQTCQSGTWGSAIGAAGPTGPTGPTGAAGPTGPTGPGA